MLNNIRSIVDHRVFPGVSCCLCRLVHRSRVLVGGCSRCAETWRLTLEILEDHLSTVLGRFWEGRFSDEPRQPSEILIR